MNDFNGVILQPISENINPWSKFNGDQNNFLNFFQNAIVKDIGNQFHVKYDTSNTSGYLLIPYYTKQKSKKCFGLYSINNGEYSNKDNGYYWYYNLNFDKSYKLKSIITEKEIIENADFYGCEFEKVHNNTQDKFHYRLDNPSKEFKIFINKLVEEQYKPLPIDTIPQGNKNPSKTEVTTLQYSRDKEIVAWILQNSNGYCECCKEKSPFNKEDGSPFLEVHHMKQLSENGSDTVTNAIAICPNCHRELHYGINNKILMEHIYSSVKRLLKE